MKSILVVEDERRIAQIATDYLQHAGFAVITAADGEEALAVARERPPDLVVLDLGLPRLDGIEVARRLRRESDVPIIMLTARAEESDRLTGLDVGADDYITKPFSPRELVARVRAVLRRAEPGAAADDVLRRGDLVIDTKNMKVTRDGAMIELTATEIQLLAALSRIRFRARQNWRTSQSKSMFRPTSRSFRSIRPAFARSWPTWFPTRCAIRRPAG